MTHWHQNLESPILLRRSISAISTPRLLDNHHRHTLTAVEEPIQLLSYGLFPGTWAQPRAAFTINGLRDYHLLSLQAQISAHDYIKYLQRTTDNVAPDTVPVSPVVYGACQRGLTWSRNVIES